jgi:hypothetical protein
LVQCCGQSHDLGLEAISSCETPFQGLLLTFLKGPEENAKKVQFKLHHQNGKQSKKFKE